MELKFLSSNPHKIAEVNSILEPRGISVSALSVKIEELQTEDIEKLIRDKVLKAFDTVGRPLFVEQTGLYLKGLNGFPGGLTQIFWDRLQADAFCNVVRSTTSNQVIARTFVGYCDGKTIMTVSGEVNGIVPETPSGPRDFQWDCVFVPAGFNETFADMGETEKNKLSMRRLALDKLAHHLDKGS